MAKRADISLLFDFFVTSQRLRRVLSDWLAEADMRPDEYAVYSLLFERGPLTATQMAGFLAMPLSTVLDYAKAMIGAGHVVRTSHPCDGRAVELSLNRSGIAAHRRAHARWEVIRKQIETNLSVPLDQVRRSLAALDDSAELAGRRTKLAAAGRERRARGA